MLVVALSCLNAVSEISGLLMVITGIAGLVCGLSKEYSLYSVAISVSEIEVRNIRNEASFPINFVVSF